LRNQEQDMLKRLLLVTTLLVAQTLPALAASKDASSTKPAPSAPAAPTATQPPAVNEGIDNAIQYKHCIALARQKPDEGWEEALAWSSLGGGDAARHCGAIALIGLRQFEEGASRLEDLAANSHGDAKLRAGMLAQAGQAWLLARNPERANAAQTAALKLVPDAPDLLIDRSQSLAEAKNYQEALADLNRALTVAPNRVDALTFRAAAKRYLDDRSGAEVDIAQALKIDPLYQDAWLENGILKRLAGNDAEARQAWLKVLEIAPTSAAADMARRNIELLDVKDR
jgi:tetratricopeptide (TPR) repeat protein